MYEKELEIDEKISKFFGKSSMGYSEDPLYYYGEQDDDLMDYDYSRGFSEHAKTFNLKKSDILTIVKVITESAAYQRTSQKSMMATKSSTIIPPESTDGLQRIFKDSEALVQTRQTHMREVADISKLISNGLGLNTDFTYLIGLLHDIGHTWNGHTGERILSMIGRLDNCGYIVHNAMGAYILERENIIDRAIEEVKQFNPKVEEKDIKEFMRYIIDGVVSHNGEGVIGKIIPQDKTSKQMADEIKKCFTEKGFDKEMMPATMEGAVIRYADIIAYTRSDILDAFRLRDTNGEKIFKTFDDDYLSLIGTVLARHNNYQKMLTLENKFLLEMYGLSQRIEGLENKKRTPEEDIELARTKKEREVINKKYKEFEKYKIEYARAYISRIKQKSEVKTKVTQMMQNVFIKDLVEASKGKDYITMTPLMRKTLFTLRDLNVRKIVPYTRRIFESEGLPLAAKNLVDILADVLVDTGVAYSTIPEEKRRTTYPRRDQQEQEKTVEFLESSKNLTYERKIYHYYKKQSPKKISYMYQNVIEAMKDITRYDIEVALGEREFDGELKEVYESTKINPIKMKIVREYGKIPKNISEEDKQKLEEEILREREQDVEKAIASKMAIEYIGGMTDNTILAVLLEKNLISRKQVIEGYGRAEQGKQATDAGVKKLQKTFANNESMIYPDDKTDEEIRL